MVYVRLRVRCTDLNPGEILGVSGADEQLGQWQPEKCLLLTCSKSSVWMLKEPIFVPPGTLYNFVMRPAHGSPQWEVASYVREVPQTVSGSGNSVVITAVAHFKTDLSIKEVRNCPVGLLTKPAICRAVAEEATKPLRHLHLNGVTVHLESLLTPAATPRNRRADEEPDEDATPWSAVHYLLTPRFQSQAQSCRTSWASQAEALTKAKPASEHSALMTSVAAGALALGASGGVLGLLSGSAVGAACGVIPAIFTFGTSIPVGAAIGASAGFGFGSTTGSVVGAVCSWALFSWGVSQSRVAG